LPYHRLPNTVSFELKTNKKGNSGFPRFAVSSEDCALSPIGWRKMVGWSEMDLGNMRAALAEAKAAAASGEIPVGAVVVTGGEIIARGHNRSETDNDPSAHAEIVVLREAARRAGNYRLTDATVYVTLEPCAMCMGALVQARIERLVFGAYDPKAGAAGSAVDLSESPSFNHRFEINGGVLAEECGAVLKAFFESKRKP
jgi:tRNA(adenine34) deaminase